MNFVEQLNRLSIGKAFLIGVVLAALYYFVMFDPGTIQQASITQSQQQVADLQKQIRSAQEKLDRAAIYQKTALEVGTTINKLLSVIPEKFGSTDLLKIISNEAKVAGSSLASINPGKPEVSSVANEFEEVSVSVDLSGSFLQNMVFLSNLTKINQILIVRKFNMDLTKEGKGEDAPLVHMIAEIVAYRYRGAEALAKEKAAQAEGKAGK